MPPVPQPADVDPIGSTVLETRTARMTPHEVAFLLATSARLPAVMMSARHRLTPTLFDRDEARFVLIWRAVTAAADANGGVLPHDAMVSRELVALHAAREVASDANRLYYTPTTEQAVLGDGGLIDEVFALPISQEVEAQGMSLLVRFLNERMVADPVRRALTGLSAAETIADPSSLAAAIERHAQEIVGLDTDPGSAAVVEATDFRPPGPKITSTKLPWLDRVMEGGHAEKEVNIILGLTSGGKSSLAVQIAVEGAELQAVRAVEAGPTTAGHWYYFTWELTADQLRERIYAYGAKIHHETFAKHRAFSTAAKPDTLNAYEYDPVVNAPGNAVRGERERIAELTARLSGVNSRLQIVDYSGERRGHGTGGVEEVALYLRREAARGRRPVGVVLDYAGLAINRYIGAQKLKPDAEYSLLAGFGDAVRSQVCVPLSCTAWVLHQFHGDASAHASGATMHHSKARGSRNFSDNSDFSFGLSPYSKTTGLLTVTLSKFRRVAPPEHPTVVRFDGRFGAFLDPDQDYVVDSQTRQIVPKSYADALPVGPPPTGKRGPGPVDPTAAL